jgi:hypothetical protein
VAGLPTVYETKTVVVVLLSLAETENTTNICEKSLMVAEMKRKTDF